jgi:hypothetical protein
MFFNQIKTEFSNWRIFAGILAGIMVVLIIFARQEKKPTVEIYSMVFE